MGWQHHLRCCIATGSGEDLSRSFVGLAAHFLQVPLINSLREICDGSQGVSGGSAAVRL